VTGGVATVARLATLLNAEGIAVEDLGLRQPTLDDAFLALTGQPVAEEEPA
jgi:ABC-2 type transport system ATP-binding protein